MNYTVIVSFRFFEIIARFIFLGKCLKDFSLVEYGTISYEIALNQFIAAIFFSGTLQSLSHLSKDEEEKKGFFLFNLFIIICIVTICLWAFLGIKSLIFVFYALIYILTGWYGNQNQQVLFSFIRSLAFVAQTIFFLLMIDIPIFHRLFMSFGIAGAVILASLPIRKIRFGIIHFTEWYTYFQFQAHNLTLQLTKMTERWALLFILDKKTFGLYSTFRDFINASNLAFFSPIYQIYFNQISKGQDYKDLIKKSSFGIVIFIFFGLVSLTFFSNDVLKLLGILGVTKFTKTDLFSLLLLLSLDFSRSLLTLIIEARKKFGILFKSHFLDLLLASLSLILVFLPYSFYIKLSFVLYMRLVGLNLFLRFKVNEITSS